MDKNLLTKKVVKLEADIQQLRELSLYILKTPLTNLDKIIQELDVRLYALKEILINKNALTQDELTEKIKETREKAKKELDDMIEKQAKGESEEEKSEEVEEPKEESKEEEESKDEG